MNILFFGSTTDSVIVLEKIFSFGVRAVVTQPARPVGRKKSITPTPVETWAHERDITVLSFPGNSENPWLFADEQQVIDALEPIKADLLISASFGVKIPWETIEKAPFGGINIHPSLLPRWRGADPVPWAILTGDHQTGVSVVTLSKDFDKGVILAQKKIPILPSDTSNPLRTKLFTIGADLLVDSIPRCKAIPPVRWNRFATRFPYARKFKREDGFEAWPFGESDAARIERKWRALHPWPGVWTIVQTSRKSKVESRKIRLKILNLHLDNGKLVLDEVQLEGKKPVSWEQFRKAYLPS